MGKGGFKELNVWQKGKDLAVENFSPLAISLLPLALYPLLLNNIIRYLQQTNYELTIN